VGEKLLRMALFFALAGLLLLIPVIWLKPT
jgi:hypothetical protein